VDEANREPLRTVEDEAINTCEQRKKPHLETCAIEIVLKMCFASQPGNCGLQHCAPGRDLVPMPGQFRYHWLQHWGWHFQPVNMPYWHHSPRHCQ
jgi:hypothetical protein